MKENEKHVLEQIARFGPLNKEEIAKITPRCKEYEVDPIIKSLISDGWVEKDDNKVHISTGQKPTPESGQKGLGEKKAEKRKVRLSRLPKDIDTSPEKTIVLTNEQAYLFEKMRTDVSRDCGFMTTEEFMDWVLREARRMTEV